MTEENYNYRTSQIMLRNQFNGAGHLSIPIIPRFKTLPGDFDNLLLIGFDKTSAEDEEHCNRMVHFFLYDYRFEKVWKHPDDDVKKLSKYRAVLSPDFSIYLEMAPVMKIYNVFRNRWCGAFWAYKGLRVVPTVNWGSEDSFEYCFDGIEKGSVVAVSTYMASEHDNRQDQKDWFMAGYNEMLRRIEPEKIICYNTPFPEMQGDIVYVDYELSSWKYLSYTDFKDLDAYKIGGQISTANDKINTYIDVPTSKGGGSAYGGQWRPNPNKPNDRRFIGEPNSTNYTYNSRGELYETHIGSDGKADYETHNSDHGNPAHHENPHTHDIIWDESGPHIVPVERSNKCFLYRKEQTVTKMYIPPNSIEQNHFKSISDFTWSLSRGGEFGFIWNNLEYGVTPCGKEKYIIYLCNQPETTVVYNSPDELLEHMVGTDRLRDVITKVTVLDRTL